MCRLLGYVAHAPITLASLLGEADLYEFTELSCKHGDGWGFAWASDTGVEVAKEPDAARTSDTFAHHAHTRAADLGIVHLRWATLGLHVAPENTHPFTDSTIAFAHNGSIRPPASLDPLISDDLEVLRVGDTDSERYFLTMLAEARRANPVEGLTATVRRIAASRELEFSSLNAMIATPDELIAVCLYDPIAQEKEEEPDYYNMRYRVTPDAVVVSSTGWGSGWSSLGNGEIIVVRRDTLEVSVSAVADAQVAL
jgi:predicted glutamine amidotransferase